MCDVHYANTTVVGFTSTFTDKIAPNLIGGDIGCGVLCLKLKNFNPSFLSRMDVLKIP
jgi:RNA-splicing ligase RtcB